MAHDHSDHADDEHDGHAQGHSHVHGNERAVAIASALTGGFMLAEIVGGLVSGSLALLADAGHMLTDFAALGLAWFGFRIARRPADWKRTYGFDRFSVLAAFVNGIALIAISVWIAVEAVHRLFQPVEVVGGIMLVIAIIGLLVNVGAFWVLHRADRDNLNIRGALLHVAGDLLGSVAAIIASLVILWTGWTPIDPILSVLVVLLILRSAWFVVRDSAHVLLEAAPRGFDGREAAEAIRAEVSSVARVHHLHAWSITEERPMVTLEADIHPGGDHAEARSAIKAVLADRFGIRHATVETREP